MYSKLQDEIWQIIKSMNITWVKGNPEDLKNFFHENMVIYASESFQKLSVGREKCVDSYKRFSKNAKILEFEEKDPQIDIFGTTAIVSYSYEITYDINNEIIQDEGRDLFVFVQLGNKWQAVWRTVIPLSLDKY
jgi:hypothetical protein